MDIAKISAGRAPPYDVNAIVEIPLGGALPAGRRPDHGG